MGKKVVENAEMVAFPHRLVSRRGGGHFKTLSRLFSIFAGSCETCFLLGVAFYNSKTCANVSNSVLDADPRGTRPGSGYGRGSETLVTDPVLDSEIQILVYVKSP